MRQERRNYYLHTDHLGGTALVTKSDGTVESEQGYWAYGRHRTGGALPTDHKFTGQKLDSSGLYYYNARYYDPELGIFVSPDSMVPDAEVLIDYNRYAYARANPLHFNDPTGHEPIHHSNYPCSYTTCAKEGAIWVPVAPWTPQLHRQEYPDVSPTEDPPWGLNQSPDDNWVDLGFDWLLQHGPETREFAEGTYMVDSLKGHPGVVAARNNFLAQYHEGKITVGEVYAYQHDFGPEGYTTAWMELDGTGHFLGSYAVFISAEDNGVMTIAVNNTSGRSSFTNLRIPGGEGSLETQLAQVVNLGDTNIQRFKTVLSDQPRSSVSWGGNFYQEYSWQEPIEQ